MIGRPLAHLSLLWKERMLCAQTSLPLRFSLKVKVLVAQLCLTLCDPSGLSVARQAPLPMEFSRQEYWSGLPFPSPGDFPDPRIELGLLHCRLLFELPGGIVSVSPIRPREGRSVMSQSQKNSLKKRSNIWGIFLQYLISHLPVFTEEGTSLLPIKPVALKTPSSFSPNPTFTSPWRRKGSSQENVLCWERQFLHKPPALQDLQGSSGHSGSLALCFCMKNALQEIFHLLSSPLYSLVSR